MILTLQLRERSQCSLKITFLQNTILTGYTKCPIGIIEIKAFDNALVSVKILSEDLLNNVIESTDSDIINEAKKQLQEYFNNKRKVFDLEIASVGTEFQQKVWKVLLNIPFGKVKTYGQIAIELGAKEFTRAVGNANGKNPLWILVPCHRVIGSNSKLTGYAGGLWRKQWLLEHESKQSKLF